MTAEIITQYFTSYGAAAIFIIVLLEYLNLPGFPAGVIMPLAGIWAAKGRIPFFLALLITIAAGLTGSLILYYLGYKGGEVFLQRYLDKFPKQKPAITEKLDWVRRKGSFGIFVSKLIPMIRTIISIPAGVVKMNPVQYTVSSALGIFVWNQKKQRKGRCKALKIAMMTNNYKPFVAGVPISVERLTDSLRSRGHRVVVFAPSYDGQKEEKDVVRIRSLIRGAAGGFSVPDCLDPVIERRFREEKFDVIHVHHPMLMGKTAGYLSWKYKVPLVFTYHTRYEQYLHYIGLSSAQRLMPEFIRSFTKRCDLVIAPAPLMKDYLEQIAVKTPVKVLPTGLPEESFYPEEEKACELRRELKGDKKYLFCTVARLAKEKNIDFLIRSMKIRKETCGSDFKLALIGEGPERKHLEELVRKLSLTEEILFIGEVPNREIKNYCRAGDLFLFASKSETQGIVLLESMAAGTPVLAVKGTGTEDVVNNGSNGYMTEASEKEFADKLMDILEKKEIQVLRQGAKAAAEQFSCERVADEAVLIYSEAERYHGKKLQEKHFRKRRDVVYFHG